jgi:hypothetical protein
LSYLAALHAIACKTAAACQNKDRQGTGSIVSFRQACVNEDSILVVQKQ